MGDVLAAVLVGATEADDIAARLGRDADDVAVLIAQLERVGAIVTEPRR